MSLKVLVTAHTEWLNKENVFHPAAGREARIQNKEQLSLTEKPFAPKNLKRELVLYQKGRLIPLIIGLLVSLQF